jgi:hypothetical protein
VGRLVVEDLLEEHHVLAGVQLGQVTGVPGAGRRGRQQCRGGDGRAGRGMLQEGLP